MSGSTTLNKRQKKKRNATRRKGWRTAATSDIHELYELAVQETEAEVDILDQIWEEQRGRLASSIREDFCGTAIASMEWIRRRRTNTAIGVDIDHEVLEWGQKHRANQLSATQAKRLTIIEGDVLKTKTELVDSVVAMNFSYFLFRTRRELKRYFKCALQALKSDGLFLLDAYGGSDSFVEMEEERDLDGFTYIWDQAHYNPITGDVTNHIHFSFPDGTMIRRAFTYNWRLWTLPEIQELLIEAGFRTVNVYWDVSEDDDDDNDEWAVSTRGEACPGWIAYLVAGK